MRFKHFFAFFLLLLLLAMGWYASTIYSGSPKLKDMRLDEISGIAASIKNPDMYWVHNDGSRKIRLFLIDKKGNTKILFKGKERVEDWEAIALDPGTPGNGAYIYVGDIGDNGADREAVRIYRFREPSISDSIDLPPVEEFFLRYPDGSRDAEAMAIDSSSRQLYIFSKREDRIGVYSAPLGVSNGDTVMMKKNLTLNLEGAGPLKWVTGADISRDGSQIIIRTYGNVFYWRRGAGQPIEQALMRRPKVLKHKKELQGEAIGFSADGKGYYTVSEGKRVPLNFNKIPKAR